LLGIICTSIDQEHTVMVMVSKNLVAKLVLYLMKGGNVQSWQRCITICKDSFKLCRLYHEDYQWAKTKISFEEKRPIKT